MEIGDWKATPELSKLYREVRELGLEANVAELDAFGFTIVEGALDELRTSELRNTVVRVVESRMDRDLDVESESAYHRYDVISWLLFEDELFEATALECGPLALVRYMLGESCQLSSVNSHIKGPGGGSLPLHADNANGVPAPFGAYEQVCNVNYALTDYSLDAGCLAIVPGSHRLARQPTDAERWLEGERANPGAIPIEVPAGSAIVFRGNTWHGSFPRHNEGLRLNLTVYFCRRYLEPQEDMRRNVPPEFRERHPPGSPMSKLLGEDLAHPWTEAGPDPHKFLAGLRAGESQQG